MNLRSVPISLDNLKIIQDLWKTNFPKEASQDYTFMDGKDIFECSVLGIGDVNVKYYLVYDEDTLIGQWGLYTTKIEQKESAWLGWFSVLPEHRRKGYGTKILELFEAEARRLGFKYIRLYTGRDNLTAQACYKNYGFQLEEFNGETDMESEPLTIGSKSICDEDVPMWDDRYMEL